jgi:hypothetical protein
LTSPERDAKLIRLRRLRATLRRPFQTEIQVGGKHDLEIHADLVTLMDAVNRPGRDAGAGRVQAIGASPLELAKLSALREASRRRGAGQ